MRGKKITGISSEVRQSVSMIAILLAIPVIIGLLVMILYSSRYQAMIQRMDAVAELKPSLEKTIAEDLFAVAAGRKTYEESGVRYTLSQINGTLDKLSSETAGNGHLQLTIARRTMDTMGQYALQVGEGMKSKRPIVEIEGIVDEVRNVGRLVADMLDNFITEEIADATITSHRLHQWMWVASGAEVLLLIGALWYSRYSTNRITDSIHSSLGSMENTVRRIAEGRFGDRVSGMNVEELQELGDQINEMANQLETLIQETQQKSEHLAKAELRTMQAQINPHFLYNTLDTIVWQAESGKADEVVRLTRSLSDFFRISLSSGADWIPVPQELKHVSAYLSIQKTRYRDILDYEVDECEELQNIYMPKLLLQPLVENALYHGIKTKRGGGRIEVRVKVGRGTLTFTVKDNGKGMSVERLMAVQESLQEETTMPVQQAMEPGYSGFGLRNVDLRIRLFYRKQKGLTIRSDCDGTEVSFTIPIKTREEIDHDESFSRG
ncbi:MAG: sensor histidine kinase [Clostridia bacterium]|nr:sensor histidine kinase [Clostridia bacterium]